MSLIIIKKILFSIICIILFICYIIFIPSTWAKEDTSELPPVITSDTVHMLEKGNIISFKGNVKLVKGDTVITADEMVNFVDKRIIEGKGNVHFTNIGEQGERIEIKSEFVKYIDKDKIIILTGNPWALQDTKDSKGEYTGDKMTILTDHQKLIIEGNAKSIIYPKESLNSKENKK